MPEMSFRRKKNAIFQKAFGGGGALPGRRGHLHTYVITCSYVRWIMNMMNMELKDVRD